MLSKNADFISKYYGDAKIREIIVKQAERYGHAIGWGKTLAERGWTLPVREVGPDKISELLDDKLDVFFPIRVKDDSELVVIWDIEYFNTADPGWLFDKERQKTVFSWMEPAFLIVEDILKSRGIKYLVDVTMSGIHVWSKVKAGSEGFRAMAREGTVHPALAEKYAAVVASDFKRRAPVPPELGLAYNAAGKILEMFTHEMMRRNGKENPHKIPVTVSDTPQFAEHWPQSGISSDLTQYGHPIYMRCIRAFCSVHQKSVFRGFEELGPAVDIIRAGGISYPEAARIMWDADEAVRFYRKNFDAKLIEIPDSSDGWNRAALEYSKSELKDKHLEWETAEAHDYVPEEKRGIYYNFFDRRHANPALLTPVNLQTLAEEFGDDGAGEAKKIFADIAGCYADASLKWYEPQKFTGIDWSKYDPETAADFWGRVYWSLHKMGLGRAGGAGK